MAIRKRKYRTRPRSRGTRLGPGYVYAALCPRDRCLKVGGTHRIDERISQLRLEYPGAALLWSCKVADVPTAEQRAHQVCRTYKLYPAKELYRASLDWLGDYEVVRALDTAFRT